MSFHVIMKSGALEECMEIKSSLKWSYGGGTLHTYFYRPLLSFS